MSTSRQEPARYPLSSDLQKTLAEARKEFPDIKSIPNPKDTTYKFYTLAPMIVKELEKEYQKVGRVDRVSCSVLTERADYFSHVLAESLLFCCAFPRRIYTWDRLFFNTGAGCCAGASAGQRARRCKLGRVGTPLHLGENRS